MSDVVAARADSIHPAGHRTPEVTSWLPGLLPVPRHRA
jgi:hypothetical protein